MSNVFNLPTLRPVHVCGHELPQASHICAFFESEQQQAECVAPYFAEGLAQGEQIVSIRDAADCTTHLDRLKALLPNPVDEAIRANQLRIVASEETYLKDGIFEAERMFNMLEGLLRDVAASPFRRVRTCGDMRWAMRNMPGTDELMEYESRVNVLTRQYDCTLMCAYDVNQISGKAMMDILATHPMVVMGDRIYENQYYVEPAKFLQTLVRRGPAPMKRAPVAA